MGLGAWLGWRESGLAEIGSVDLYLKWTCGGDFNTDPSQPALSFRPKPDLDMVWRTAEEYNQVNNKRQ